MIKHFFDDDINVQQSVESADRLKKAVVSTMPARQRVRDTIMVEMQLLMNTLATAVRAEADYHRSIGVFMDLSSLGPYLSTSAPEFAPGSQYTGLAAQEEVDPRTEVASSNPMPSSVPSVTLSLALMRRALGDVDRHIRLFSHRVKHLRQILFLKDIELRELNEELSLSRRPTNG